MTRISLQCKLMTVISRGYSMDICSYWFVPSHVTFKVPAVRTKNMADSSLIFSEKSIFWLSFCIKMDFDHISSEKYMFYFLNIHSVNVHNHFVCWNSHGIWLSLTCIVAKSVSVSRKFERFRGYSTDFELKQICGYFTDSCETMLTGPRMCTLYDSLIVQ